MRPLSVGHWQAITIPGCLPIASREVDRLLPTAVASWRASRTEPVSLRTPTPMVLSIAPWLRCMRPCTAFCRFPSRQLTVTERRHLRPVQCQRGKPPRGRSPGGVSSIGIKPASDLPAINRCVVSSMTTGVPAKRQSSPKSASCWTVNRTVMSSSWAFSFLNTSAKALLATVTLGN